MYRRAYVLLVTIPVVMGVIALICAHSVDRSLVDPEGFLGPSWTRLPMLVVAALVADMVPQYFWKGRGRPGPGWAAMKERWHTWWTRERLLLVVLGIASYYITYVSYRNIKSFLPFVMGDTKYDRELHVLDRAIFLGHEPATVLHAALGTGIVAQVLSLIYVTFIPMVAVMVAIYAVWSRNIRFGYWFVGGQVLIWSLGTALYYCLPTLGPGYRYPWLYTDLPKTGAGDLLDALFYGRTRITYGDVDNAVQSIAAFASLHTGCTLIWALMVQYTVRARWIKIVAWTNFGTTVLATLYFGWHYVADDIAGVAMALVSFVIAGWAAGIKFTKKDLGVPPSKGSVARAEFDRQEAAGAAGAEPAGVPGESGQKSGQKSGQESGSPVPSAEVAAAPAD